MKYEVLTSKSVLDVNVDNYDIEIGSITQEQNEVLYSLGFDFYDSYVVRVDNKEIVINDIYDSIQGLALKEGANLVRFESGNIGFVGYYGNRSIENNCFEILRTPTKEDIENWENSEPIAE